MAQGRIDGAAPCGGPQRSTSGQGERPQRSAAALVVSWVAVALWCLFIFYMSAKVAADSDALSNGLIYRLLMLVFGGIDPDLAKSLSHPVRKLAHFSEYALLGALLINALARTLAPSAMTAREEALQEAPQEALQEASQEAVWSLKAALPTAAGAWGLGVLYAASDEFHQLFVPGRSGQITDVLIDASGVLVGVAIALLVWRALSRRRARG